MEIIILHNKKYKVRGLQSWQPLGLIIEIQLPSFSKSFCVHAFHWIFSGPDGLLRILVARWLLEFWILSSPSGFENIQWKLNLRSF